MSAVRTARTIVVTLALFHGVAAMLTLAIVVRGLARVLGRAL